MLSRLSTILRADQILIMSRGGIVERGTHAELIGREGLYARLSAEQFGLETASRSSGPASGPETGAGPVRGEPSGCSPGRTTG